MSTPWKKPFLPGLIFLFISVLLSSGCVGPGKNSNSSYPAAHKSAQDGYLSLFLNLKEEQGPAHQVHLQSIDVLSDSGGWSPLALNNPLIRTLDIGKGQIFLARGDLKVGYYSRLRFTLEGEESQQGEAIELTLPKPLYLERGDSHSLFITWDVRGSNGAGDEYQPVLSIAPRLKNLIADVAYVSCPEINTVFMIRTDKNRVYGSLGVGDRPNYLFASPILPEENLFALTSARPGIKRISPSANRIVDNYPLPMMSSATHMTLGPLGQKAYVIERKRGNLLKIDLQTGHVENRVRLGYGPVYIIFLEKRNQLAVSLNVNQSVVLLDPESLTTVGSIATGNKPEGLMLFRDSMLYIAESGGNSVLVYDLERGKISKRIPVNISPKRILAAYGLIYVSNYRSKNISLLHPGQLSASRTITLSGTPLELSNIRTSKWLYVGNANTNSISVVDPVSTKIVSQIPLGARPGGIEVINR